MLLAEVAQSYCEGISGITGSGARTEPELHAHHALDLVLVASAVVGHTQFHLCRRIGGYRDAMTGGGQHGDGLCPADGQGGPNVAGHERVLDSHLLGAKADNEVGEAQIQLVEAFREGHGAAGGEHAALYHRWLIAAVLQHSVAHGQSPRIDAKDSHMHSPWRRDVPRE